MAARGAEAKEKITNQILEAFEGAFKHEKEIRIPVMENGERVEIKVTLTAAKVNVGGDAVVSESKVELPWEEPKTAPAVEVTAQEKENISNFLQSMGF